MTQNEAIMNFMNGHPSIAQSEWILQGTDIDVFVDMKERAINKIIELHEATKNIAEVLGDKFVELAV